MIAQVGDYIIRGIKGEIYPCKPDIFAGSYDSTGEKYFIDFTLETESNRYAIETDGLYYHASGAVGADYFEKLQRKQNEIINQGYKLIRLTSTYIAENTKDARYELRRSFVADVTMNDIRKKQSNTIQPHEIQREALEALNETRNQGKKKGVVVFATGVGKTYLSAFDSKQTDSERILFVVHVKEILRQSLLSPAIKNLQRHIIVTVGFLAVCTSGRLKRFVTYIQPLLSRKRSKAWFQRTSLRQSVSHDYGYLVAQNTPTRHKSLSSSTQPTLL
jgi:hypothetical protein